MPRSAWSAGAVCGVWIIGRSGQAGGESVPVLWWSDRQSFEPGPISQVRAMREASTGAPASPPSSDRPRSGQTIDWVKTWDAGLAGLAWDDFSCASGWETAVSARSSGLTIRGSIATWR